MSGFGGFGSGNTQQNTGFGGFGSNNNTGSGFGAATGTGFGGSSGSLFGNSSNNQQTTPAFGSGGFGSGNTGGAFGSSQPAFGATSSSGGGLFGSSTATAGAGTGFGGFGNNNNNASNNTGSIFGGAGTSKPAFGSSNTGGGSLFGNSNTSGGAFGASNQTNSAFGTPLSNALGTTTDSCPGSGQTPFQAYTEKEPNGNTTNVFNNISAMPSYLKYSPEELRVVDYNQGRRFGNTSGFGTGFGSTGFGGTTTNNTSGFGGANTSGGGLFGSQNTGTGGFGNNQTSTGFGANAGGGIFGSTAAKPASGGLFGNTNTNNQPGGGLFGASNQNQGGFNSQQPQNQSTGFTFGTNNNANNAASTNTNTNTGSNLFGNTANNNNTSSGGGLFGSSSGGSNLFGNNQQQQNQQSTGFGGFGQTQQNQQNQNQSGSGGAFGGFGNNNNQQKPGGLFGNTSTNTNTGGGLFGNTAQNNQQSNTSGGIFGNTNNTNQSGGGLFGAKPANTGTSLFGNQPASNTNNSGGLFGGFNNNNNTTQTQNAGSSLFGNTNNQQPKTGGLFGNTNANSAGGLFGNNNQQPANNSLFNQSNNANNTQQNGGLFGATNNSNAGNSLFGNSQQQQQQQPNILLPPQAMTASITDSFPWGSASIFAGLPPVPVSSPGPIATPIKVSQKQRKSIISPQYKLSPAASSRLVTPQRRGYGFTYSTYGTPSSVQSNASTPGGFSASRLGGSLTRNLGKSLSTSNLRRSFDPDGESLLSPGAFSAGSSRYANGGSLKKLTIDRSLRTDLFGSYAPNTLPTPDKGDQSRQPGILKKKVSFDSSTIGGNGSEDSDTTITNGDTFNATPSAQEQGFLRPKPNGRTPNGKTNGVQPDMEQVRGNELAVVHEDGSPEPNPASITRNQRQSQEDQTPGEYYMIPSRAEIARTSPEQRARVEGFKVGREGCGFVVFNKPVDLNQVPVEKIIGEIVVIDVRSCTVYPTNITKPGRGTGLNVHSTIHLENSWPRNKNKVTPTYEKSGAKFDRHIERLRRVAGTKFVRYEKDTGTWVFTVPHFTTYALDYDETESEGESLHQSRMSENHDSPTPRRANGGSGSSRLLDSSMQGSPFSVQSRSEAASSPDDTFEFRRNRVLPGAFDDEAIPEAGMNDPQNAEHGDTESFLGDGPASVSEDDADEPSDVQDSVEESEDHSIVIKDSDAEVDMAGSFPEAEEEPNAAKEDTPTQFKPTFFDLFGTATLGTPPHLQGKEAAWAEALQDTISPYKHDRQRIQKSAGSSSGHSLAFKRTAPIPWPNRRKKTDLTTSIDLMNSIFGQEEMRRSRTALSNGKDVQKVQSDNLISSRNRPFDKKSTTNTDHASNESSLNNSQRRFPTKGQRQKTENLIVPSLEIQRSTCHVDHEKGVPVVHSKKLPFRVFSESLTDESYEKAIWDIASILNDPIEPEVLESVPTSEKEYFENRYRKDRLAQLWANACESARREAARDAENPEEAVIALLAANKVEEACKLLMKNRNYRLAILVAQIGGETLVREDIAEQINEWRKLKALSEISDPIRAIYELLAGNTCVSEGSGKAHIEDRVDTFTISERFDMDWKSALGLRLWYGIDPDGPWHVAVLEKYEHDVLEGREPRTPFANGSKDTVSTEVRQQDFLWSLLRFEAQIISQQPQEKGDFVKSLLPQNQSDPPLNSRLSFQLYQNYELHARENLDDPESAAQIINDFAEDLSAAGQWLWALFIALHLPDAASRKQSIRTLLNANASQFSDDEQSETFKTVTQEFKIPAKWVFEAQALHAETQLRDPAQQTSYLLKAGNWDEAHDVLCSVVGPKAIIEQDYPELRRLLKAFEKGKSEIAGWATGGRVLEDFLKLLDDDDDDSDGIQFSEKERSSIIKRMVKVLPSAFRGSWGNSDAKRELSFEEKVAVKEMSALVGRLALEIDEGSIDGSKLLRLPMMGDEYAKQTREMGMRYFRGVMTMAH